jgi:hypothetical protein
MEMAIETISESVLTADEVLANWQGHRRLTRRTIEAFPEDKLFQFSVGGMRPFAELASEFIRMAIPVVEGVATYLGCADYRARREVPEDSAAPVQRS